jgi:hypothetical protein
MINNKTNPTDMREMFEAWFIKTNGYAPKDYITQNVGQVYEAWQAAYNHKPAIVYDEVCQERDRYKAIVTRLPIDLPFVELNLLSESGDITLEVDGKSVTLYWLYQQIKTLRELSEAALTKPEQNEGENG